LNEEIEDLRTLLDVLGELELLLELDGIGDLSVLCQVLAGIWEQLRSMSMPMTRLGQRTPSVALVQLTLKGAAQARVKVVLGVGAAVSYEPWRGVGSLLETKAVELWESAKAQRNKARCEQTHILVHPARTGAQLANVGDGLGLSGLSSRGC
jgi:hypothetical protein